MILKFACVLCFISTLSVTSELIESQVQNYVKQFKETLHDHMEEKLALSKIRSMIGDHEKELGIRPINGSQEFQRIFQSIQLRYTDLQRSVVNLKSTIETNVNGLPVFTVPVAMAVQNDTTLSFGSTRLKTTTPRSASDALSGPQLPPPPEHSGSPPLSGSGPTLPMRSCCLNLAPHVYSGRFREKVTMEECYENTDDNLTAIRNTGLVRTMKANLRRDSSVTWQYFVSTHSHYIQYPTNTKACDKQANSPNSPFAEEWFIEKLRMERKNLVLLLDNGASTKIRISPVSPHTHRSVISDAAQRIIKTLTSDDKVNVVQFPYGSSETGVVAGCSKNLLIPTESNKILLGNFVKAASNSKGQPNLMEGLTTVYELLKNEKLENENPSKNEDYVLIISLAEYLKNGTRGTFNSRLNLVILLIDGTSTPTDLTGTALLEMIARYQHDLDNSVQHLVYTLGEPASDDLHNRLMQIADQNNVKALLNDQKTIQQWPAIPGLVSDGHPVGKEGAMIVVKDIQTYPATVSKYFQILPLKLDNTNDVTIITPILDNVSGVTMTLTDVVYTHSKVVGVVAVDSSLATVFSEINNFDVGKDSYMFLVDLNHGHVLMHPKLRDPDETLFEDTIFPRLELIEPDISQMERTLVLNASATMKYFPTAQLKRVRSLVSGEVAGKPIGTPIPATVYYQRLIGTHLCVVLVHFSTDMEEARLQTTQGASIDQLHAPYHRIDKTVGAPFPNRPNSTGVCHLNGNFVSFRESVIKLSPSVFSEPERYKYKVEAVNDISEINSFLINGGQTNLIRDDAKALILQTVRATDGLDSLWRVSSKDIIDRFFGSTSGVFRLFPGLPLQNNFDHMKSDWYKRSIAFPNTTFYHYDKLTGVTRNKVVIVSSAVTEQGRLQGVVGLTVTARYLTSQLLNSVNECLNSDIQCHIVDASGYILDVTVSKKSANERHISKQYPWLFKDLIDIHAIQTCSGCSMASVNPRYQLHLPECESCQFNETQCQCPCYCMTDFDTCHGQFKTNIISFPSASCFNRLVGLTLPELEPDSPGPIYKHCSIPCATIEDMTICSNISHCKTSSDVYPVCIWKDKDEMMNKTEDKFLPTTPVLTPPPLKTSSVNKPTPPPINAHLSRQSSVSMSKTTQLQPTLISSLAAYTTETPGVTLPIFQKTSANRLTAPSSVSSSKTTSHIISRSASGIVNYSSSISTVPVSLRKSTQFVTVQPAMSTRSIPGPAIMTITSDKTNTEFSTTHGTLGKTGKMSNYPSSLTAANGYTSTLAIVTSTSDPNTYPGSTNSFKATNEDYRPGMDGGKIAAIIIGVLAAIILVVIILIKLYGKKFRRAGAADSSKYLAGSGIFNSSYFTRSTEEVALSIAPSSTTVEYTAMTD